VVARVRGEQAIDKLLAHGLNSSGKFSMAGRTHIDAAFAWAITIGDQVTIAHDVLIIAHDAATKRWTGYTCVRPVNIGARSYIGAGAVILPGSDIGEGAIVGGGSVVRGVIPAGAIAVGNPAQVVGETQDFVDRHRARLAEMPCFDHKPTAKHADRAALRMALTRAGTVYVR
jgi:maltose O-acetyltransferase